MVSYPEAIVGLTESVTVPNVEQDVFYRLACVHIDQPDLHVPTISSIEVRDRGHFFSESTCGVIYSSRTGCLHGKTVFQLAEV